MLNKKAAGNMGEDAAVKYLKKRKYKIVERNMRTKFGEIDIIACKEGVYVFVEVKARSTEAYGKGFEAVDARKQQHIRRAAEFYCRVNRIEALCRFDVISIDGGEITHIENAF